MGAVQPKWRQAMMHSQFWHDQELVTKVFENVYHDEHVKKYLERKGIQRMKNMPQETLMTMKINIFLNSNYELRKNVMRGVAEYRLRTGIGFSFQDLTEEARNSITMRAMEQGIKCSKRKPSIRVCLHRWRYRLRDTRSARSDLRPTDSRDSEWRAILDDKGRGTGPDGAQPAVPKT